MAIFWITGRIFRRDFKFECVVVRGMCVGGLIRAVKFSTFTYNSCVREVDIIQERCGVL